MQTQLYYVKNARPGVDGTLEVRGGQTLKHTIGTGGEGKILALFGYELPGEKRWGDEVWGASPWTGDPNESTIYSVKQPAAGGNKIYMGETEVTGDDFSLGAQFVSVAAYRGYIFFATDGANINYTAVGSTTRLAIGGWDGIIQYGGGAPPWPGLPEPRYRPPTPTQEQTVVPRGKFMTFYKDRCYVSSGDDVLVYSDAGMFTHTPSSCLFRALNYVTLGRPGVERIMGIASNFDYLITFTRDGYHAMSGAPGDNGAAGDMSWREFHGLGCISSRSIGLWPRGILYLAADRRLYSLEGLTPKPLDLREDITEYLEAVDYTVLEYVSVKYFNGEIWMYMPKGSNATVGHIVVYNIRAQSWTVFEDIDGYTFGKLGSYGQLFVGAHSGGYIWEQDSGDDDLGSKIAFEVITRPEPLGSYARRKIISGVIVQADLNKDDSMSFEYSLDNSDTFTPFAAGSPLTGIGLVSTVLRFARGNKVRAREFTLRVVGTATRGARLLSYNITYEPETRDAQVI
jgi:hypothetical protein